jgi:ubiquinone/menaquinone biosynthesis C-methylase UbiE
MALPAAQRVGPMGEIVALDVQPAMLARLRARLAEAAVHNVVLRQADIAAPDVLAGEQFDRAWLVTVLGEIPDRQAALRNIYRLLRPGGVFSITEIFPDPHYQGRATVLRLGQEAGFIATQRWGTALAFTQNFARPGIPS